MGSQVRRLTVVGFRGAGYAGVAGADLENAPTGDVPFTSPFGLPVTRMNTWYAGGNEPGAATGGVPGRPVQRASGNPAIATVPSQVERQPYGGGSWSRIQDQSQVDGYEGPGPGVGYPQGVGQPNTEMVGGISQFGSPAARVLQQGQETAVRAPGNAPVGYSNDKLIAYDRHGIFKVGYENSGRMSGQTDPPMDGPPRPSLWLIQRTINYQQGTDETAATDDLSRDYTRNDSGMYMGEQGTGWSPIYGGTPGLYQEYGSYQGISPSTPGYDPVSGTTQGIVSPEAQGGPGDGPHTLWGGPPHGLHSPTLPDYSQTLGRYMAIPQMAAPRVDRPSNSPIAGQSYSQTVQPQGQVGTVAQNTQFGSGVNFNQRARGNGWRGRAAGG
jgi:hypothetical protein